MIETLGFVSRVLQWAKPLIVVVGIASFALFVCTIFKLAGFETDTYLMPSVVGTLWSTLFFFLTATFHRVPDKPLANVKWFSRVKIRCKRGFFYVLALLFLVLTLAAIRMSFSMLGIWRDTYQ
jgi:hypothetical protein